jgi:hypothetical protein
MRTEINYDNPETNEVPVLGPEEIDRGVRETADPWPK